VKKLWFVIACAVVSFGCREPADDAEPCCAPASEQSQGPLLVYDASIAESVTTTSRLMAIPAARIGLDEPALFYETPERFPINDFKYWSPNGEVLIFDEGWFELSDASWTNRLLFSRAGRGELTPPRLIPDLPGEGSYSLDDFDVTTNTALLSTQDELYVVTFDGEEPRSSLVLRSDAYLDAWLCRGGADVVLVSWSEDGARIAPREGADTDAALLTGAYAVEPSPNRDFVAVTYVDEETYSEKVALGRCSLEPELAFVAESDDSVALLFSPDGKRLLVSGSSGDSSWLRVLELGSEPPGEVVFEGEGGVYEARWSDDGAALVVFPDDDGPIRLLRVAEQTFEALPAEVVSVDGWVDEYLAVSDEESNLLLIDSSAGGDPVLVLEAEGGSVSDVVVAPGGKYFACVRRTEEQEELFVVEASRGAEGAELAYSGASVPALEVFPGASLGVFAIDDSEDAPALFWLPLGPDRVREPVVYSPAQFPALQPLP
jgi:hypothetical protein